MSLIVSSVATEESLVALTFDDGPHELYTPMLLDLFDDEAVPATFFIRGAALNTETRAIIVRMAASGHDVGNHTHHHRDLSGVDAPTLREEIECTHYELDSIIGHPPTLLRPPYGFGAEVANSTAETLGYRSTVLWSACGYDWQNPQPPASEITERVLNGYHECHGLGPGGIVLLHDSLVPREPGESRVETVGAVRKLVPTLRARGMRFVTVSELLDAANIP